MRGFFATGFFAAGFFAILVAAVVALGFINGFFAFDILGPPGMSVRIFCPPAPMFAAFIAALVFGPMSPSALMLAPCAISFFCIAIVWS